MNPIKAYWWHAANFGDTLTPIILEHFTKRKVRLMRRNDTGKLLGIGSIMVALRENDVVWGTGTNRDRKMRAPKGTKFVAVRGPITRSKIIGAKVPEIYGDPALLLPLIYNPKVKKTHKIGYLPHYVDKIHVLSKYAMMDGYCKYIDIQADWQTVINEVLSCEKIIASSLHGIICAEAYGIPAQWAVYSDKIRGGDLKYQDYFLGTDRTEQKHFTDLPPIKNLPLIQGRLIGALEYALTAKLI